MELQHVNVKIPVEGELGVDPRLFIDVFHQWIREGLLDELLIDVADYRHVPAGPGVMLIGHEADYSLDNAGGRWGLRYNRKAVLAGSNEDRFAQALRSAAGACRLLEKHFASDDPLEFSRREFELFINDRAMAPNTPETWAVCQPELSAFAKRVCGQGDFSMEQHGETRARFGVTVQAARPFDLTKLLDSTQKET